MLFYYRTEFMPNNMSAKAMSGENACPRCGCPVFEAEKLIAANKVSQHDSTTVWSNWIQHRKLKWYV